MDDTQVLVTGKVRWLDPAASRGVITGVGGVSYVFLGESDAETLDIGQLVTFRDMGRCPIGRVAAGVRPLSLSEADPEKTSAANRFEREETSVREHRRFAAR